MLRGEGSVPAFFLLTFGATWASWGAAQAVAGEGSVAQTPFGLPRLLLFLGIVAPAVMALALTARADGREGVHELLRRVVRWRVGLRWYVFALTYTAGIKLVAATVHRAAVGEWPRFGDAPVVLMLAAARRARPACAFNVRVC